MISRLLAEHQPRAQEADAAPRDACSIVRDLLGRRLTSLRLSVTDRCNLRCFYCMPREDYSWLPRKHLLDFDEIERLVDAFCELGARRIRLTGGEPLLRRDLEKLVARLASKPLVEDLGMTTNGVLLKQHAQALRNAGLQRVTISLDTLRPERYRQLTRRDDYKRVLEGIQAADQAGFQNTKLNVVLIRGFNQDELEDFIHFGQNYQLEVRFIEYMDVGGATDWKESSVFSRTEILERLRTSLGPLTEAQSNPNAPAERFQLANGTTFGIIASTTTPFCGTCDRSRLTADGTWLQCLYAKSGMDLRAPLRQGASQAQLIELLGSTWNQRDDRGAEQRLTRQHREPLASNQELRTDPHREMHTRGG